MNGDEVLKLIDAGFTAAEIREMQKGPAPEIQTAGDKQSEGDHEAHAGEVKTAEIPAEITNTLADIQASVKAIQDANLKKTVLADGSNPSDLNGVIKSFLDTL